MCCDTSMHVLSSLRVRYAKIPTSPKFPAEHVLLGLVRKTRVACIVAHSRKELERLNYCQDKKKPRRLVHAVRH